MDGRPNLRNKAALSNFSGALCWTLSFDMNFGHFENIVDVKGMRVSVDSGFCTLRLNWVCFQEESSLSIGPSTKALHKLCLRQLCQPQRL